MTDNPDDYWCMVPALAQVPLPERMNLSIPRVMVSGFLINVYRLVGFSKAGGQYGKSKSNSPHKFLYKPLIKFIIYH